MKKLIGITAGYKPESNNQQKLELYYAYISSLSDQGALPVVLPPTAAIRDIQAIVNTFDGFVLSGGGDIDPSLMGRIASAHVPALDRERDLFELTLTRTALRARKPILGICKGAQVLNVACGGTLIGDIPSEYHTQINHAETTHPIRINGSSRLGKIVRKEHLTVNSTHHQSVKTPGKGLRAVAFAPDGIIEAIETIDTTVFAIGVQFHPERMYKKSQTIAKLFRRFIETC